MVFTAYGKDMIFGSAIIALFFIVLSLILKLPILTFFAIICSLFFFFNLYFFRDPERYIQGEENAILSPADGKIIQIDEIREDNFFKSKVKRVSIFLSVFNVHVNRVPISGKVEYFRYIKGKFLAAFKSSASLENERSLIGIENANGNRILFSQIAGVIARRIVCKVREGYTVQRGERMGMIRFGSRVDIFFPSDSVKINVTMGQKVKGGETIIGFYQ